MPPLLRNLNIVRKRLRIEINSKFFLQQRRRLGTDKGELRTAEGEHRGAHHTPQHTTQVAGVHNPTQVAGVYYPTQVAGVHHPTSYSGSLCSS
jgi:hypothetical protein